MTYRPDLFVLILRYCTNLKAIRYESTSLNRIVADKSHRVIVAYASSSVAEVFVTGSNSFFVTVFHHNIFLEFGLLKFLVPSQCATIHTPSVWKSWTRKIRL